jgi:TolB-like protein
MCPSLTADPRPQIGRLDSWKEIAAYLRRGARTVQRWERLEGLPVRRLYHEKLGSVYAFKHEIDAWFSRRADGRLPAEIDTAPASVAVLRFADWSEQRDQESFCDGVAEEIAHALGRLDGVRTARCRAHEADCRRIGRRLGVKALLQGSVRTWGDRVRIAVELVDAESGFRLWSDRYDRTLGDAFRVQDEIADCVLRALEPRLASRTHECHDRGQGRY